MFSIALLSILIMKVVSISAQSMRLQDAPLGSVVQIGSFNYVKIAENKYMQSTQVACPDSATVGGMYVKCFKDKSAYESTCSGSGSCNCEYTSIGDVDTTGGTGYDVYTYECDIPCYTPNTTYDSALAKCVCNESGYSYVHTRSSTGTGFACVNASIAYADYYSGMDFDYTGDVQTFTAPVDGTYKLEVWGAQGGSGANDYSRTGTGGNGGYSYGQKLLQAGDVLYIVVGGKGANHTSSNTSGPNIGGGFNGGGGYSPSSSCCYVGGGGGGATHIATVNGLLSTLSSMKSEIIIVAGGGGGGGTSHAHAPYQWTGGNGGGTNGGNGSGISYTAGGGTQNSAGASGCASGSFGLGAYCTNGGGGGGGLYGGNSNSLGAGGGGSGYIGGVNNGNMSNGAREGNGYARITLISVD